MCLCSTSTAARTVRSRNLKQCLLIYLFAFAFTILTVECVSNEDIGEFGVHYCFDVFSVHLIIDVYLLTTLVPKWCYLQLYGKPVGMRNMFPHHQGTELIVVCKVCFCLRLLAM